MASSAFREKPRLIYREDGDDLLCYVTLFLKIRTSDSSSRYVVQHILRKRKYLLSLALDTNLFPFVVCQQA